MSPDGKPIQVNASALQSAGSQNNIGMIQLGKMPQSDTFETELSICQKEGCYMKFWYRIDLDIYGHLDTIKLYFVCRKHGNSNEPWWDASTS